MKQHIETVKLDKIVGDGQTLGTLADGRKVFVWGALPGETAEVRITKRKSRMAQAVAERIITAAPERIEPKDPESFLSTSPWQIMSYEAEVEWKKKLVQDAFKLHDVDLYSSELISDANMYGYRNKVEFSWWWDNDTRTLELAFFRRGTHGKIPVDGTGLAWPEINDAARRIRDLLRSRGIQARALKTLIMRCNQKGSVNAQLYVKDATFDALTEADFTTLKLNGFEIIFSNPKSPASVVTKLLATFGQLHLTDTLLDVEFQYAVGSFFQINLPVYEMALRRMQEWVQDRPIIDMYSGVGTIGLTINGGFETTLVEQDPACIDEMRRNIDNLDSTAEVVHAASEDALGYITRDHTVIVDPPRAGLHQEILYAFKDILPPRIIYLSYNPVTQARDVANLLDRYRIAHAAAFNFFPRTPHIEHLIVLDIV